MIPYSTGSFDHRGNGEQKWAAPGRVLGVRPSFFLERPVVELSHDVTVVTEMDLKHEIEKDIKRYSSILEKYKSGKLETGDLEGQDHLLDKTTDVSRHLENIIRELQALLRDG